MSDPIHSYLDELSRHLHGSREARRRILVEVEDHLREKVRELGAAGYNDADSEALAIVHFGPARQMGRELSPLPECWAVAIARAFRAGLLAGLLLIVLGLSMMAAVPLDRLFGGTLDASAASMPIVVEWRNHPCALTAGTCVVRSWVPQSGTSVLIVFGAGYLAVGAMTLLVLAFVQRRLLQVSTGHRWPAALFGLAAMLVALWGLRTWDGEVFLAGAVWVPMSALFLVVALVMVVRRPARPVSPA
jgi:hypothetical protein